MALDELPSLRAKLAEVLREEAGALQRALEIRGEIARRIRELEGRA